MSYIESSSTSAAPYNGQKASTSEDSIMKNVNLYRGAVATDITLVSLDGRDGLDLSLALNYTPEDGMFPRPNLLCGSSVAGFGFSMPLAAILVKNRNSRETFQSQYRLTGGGGEYPLYRTGRVDDHVTFMSVEHPFWRFSLYPDRWEVVKDDGAVWTYGGTVDSVEVNVCWGNWTGACMETGGEEFPVGWYLSKVVNRYGDSIGFGYENVRIPLGGGSYTSEMHLLQATSVFGQTVRLNYGSKTSAEYDLPHVPGESRHQFLCERHYLESLDVFSCEGALLYSQRIAYDLVPTGAGDERKRLLVAVSQVTKDGETLPPLRLDWNLEGESAGHLRTFRYPRDGALGFGYAGRKAAGYRADTFLGCGDDWDRSVANGADFTAALLTRDDRVRLDILSWDMEWQVYEDDALRGRTVKEPSLMLGNGIVVVSYQSSSGNYAVRVVKRVPVRRYDWKGFDVNLQCTDRPAVACGEDFVAVQEPGRNVLTVYQFDYTDNQWHRFDLPVDVMGRQALGACNGCVFGAYGYDGASDVRLSTFYCDEEHRWNAGDTLTVPIAARWDYEARFPVWSVNGSIASACFVADCDDHIEATVIALAWDSGFHITGTTKLDVSQSKSVGNPAFFCVATDTMIGFADTAFRYTPSGFVRQTLFDISDECEYSYAYGCDLFLAVEKRPDGNQRFLARRFDAASGVWTDDGVPYAEGLSGFDDICRPYVASDYAVLGRMVFRRGTDERWTSIGSLPNGTDFTSVRLESGGGYLLYTIPSASSVCFVPLTPFGLDEPVEIQGVCTGRSTSYEPGASCFFLPSAPGQTPGLSFRSIFRRTYHAEAPSVLLLDNVVLDSGMDRQTVYLDYDMSTARLENDSFAAGTASVLPAVRDGGFGKTVNSYYNGSDPSRADYPPSDERCNVADYYTHFGGQAFLAVSYDGDGMKLSETRVIMKAFDSHGFCIQQTGVSRSEFVRRVCIDDPSEEPVVDEIRSSFEYSYEPKYLRKRTILQRAFNRNGRELVTSQTVRYAFEDYPGMEQANILDDVSLTTKRREGVDGPVEASRYEYSVDGNGRYYRSAEYAMGRKEGDWLPVEVVTEVDTRGNLLCRTDGRGIAESTLYDSSGRYPVAVTKNARPAEVLYCGFEQYESMERLTVDGAPVREFLSYDGFFSGTRSLSLDSGRSLIARLAVKDGGLRLRFSVRSQKEIHVSVDFGLGDVSERSYPAEEGWVSHLDVFSASGAPMSASVSIRCDGQAFVDAVYISPVLANGEAYVYSGDLMLQCATHLNGGSGSRTYFDRHDSPCLETGDDGRFRTFSNTVYGTCDEPNMMFTVKPSSFGAWYDSRQGYTANPLFGPNGGGWRFQQAGDFALIFIAEGALPSISLKGMSLRSDGKLWTLRNGSKTELAIVPEGSMYLFLCMGGRCMFQSEGSVLFSFELGQGSGGLAFTETDAVRCLGYVPDPGISLSCSDYSGRVFQDQILTRRGVLVSHTLYDEIGVQLAKTRQVEIAGVMLGYRVGFVSAYDRMTGRTAGEVCDLFPEADDFPCVSYRTTASPEPEVKEVAQPGKAYAFGGGLTVSHRTCSAGGLKGFLQDGFCKGDLAVDPDGMMTVSLEDGDGKVLSAKLSSDGRQREMTAYDVDCRGNTTRIYYPNYFTNALDAGKFVSELTYDSLGNLASRKDPDSDEVLSVYDRFGDLRFLRQDEGSGRYVYHLYDALGRQTKMGYVAETWDDDFLRKAADGQTGRPTGGVPLRQMYYDTPQDGAEAACQAGKLTRMVTECDGRTVEECYSYDSDGRQVRYTLVADGRTEECLTRYDDVGNVIARSTGKLEDGVLEYSYGVGGELTSVSYNGTPIYGCGYTAQGSLGYETFGPDFRRDYRYDTANFLTRIEGGFLDQSISYSTANGATEEAKKGGQISSVRTRFSGGGIPGYDSMLSASYDALGRVSKVTVDGDTVMDLRYDANGNQVRDGLAYSRGSDRLSTMDGEDVSYEGFGAVRGIGDRLSIKYDPMLQEVLEISSGTTTTGYLHGDGVVGFDDGHGLTLSVKSEDGRPFCERDLDGRLVLLVYGSNGLFAQILDGKVYYMVKDYRSTVCAVTDGRNLLSTYEYNLFGGVIRSWEADTMPDGLIPYRFAGARLEASGLYRFKFRFYDPASGRFLSPDPEGQHSCPYVYGGCDWINYFDPDGAFDVGGFCASLFTGLALLVVGIAVTVMTAGIGGAVGVGLATLSAGIIGGGISSMIYSVTSAVNDDFSWTNWGVQVGFGALFGAVSAGIGCAAPTTMSVAGSMAWDGVSGMVVGVADGVVTNGFLNISAGKSFLDNAGMNAIIGGALGGFLGAVTGMSTAARNAKRLTRNGGPAVDQLGVFTRGKTSSSGQGTSLAGGSTSGSGFGHSGIGFRPSNVGNTTFAADLIAPGGGAAQLRWRKYNGTSPHMSWVNIKPNAYLDGATRINNLGLAPGAPPVAYGSYNIVTNTCTGFAINISTAAGIYQPLWARSPGLLNLWTKMTGAFQT